MRHTCCSSLALFLCSLWNSSLGRTFRADGLSAKDKANAVSYLEKFGYLKVYDPRVGQTRTGAELKRSIKKFQLYAGLPMTGIVDNKTMEMILMPRCGIPDVGRSDSTRRRRRYALQGTTWKKMELSYRLQGGPNRTISEKEVEENTDKAFKEWERVSTLKFKKSTNPDSDILMRFETGMHGDGYPFDGEGGTLAHAFYPHNNKDLSGDVHFDDDENWILDKNATGTDFYWTALHQIGHSLGLDHSSYHDAVMYPFYTGFKENLRLNKDDIKGIRSLYGMPEIEIPTAPPVPTKEVPRTAAPGMPNPCDTSFDAVFTDTNLTTYLFSGNVYWTMLATGRRQGPFFIRETWPKLQEGGVDAAYQTDGNITFFKGRNSWIYNGRKHLEGPVLIHTRFGLDLSVQSIDAALVWGSNGKIYLFKDEHYWRYNEAHGSIDMGYPAKINTSWVGVPNKLDSAITWINGKTYFFKRKGFWTFDNKEYKTTEQEPRRISSFWMKCREDNTSGKPLVKTTAAPVKTLAPITKHRLRPSACKTSFDVVFHSKDGNTYFFKRHHFWTLDKFNRTIQARKIADFWPKLRAGIEAAYTRQDGKTILFKGKRYWVFEGRKYIEGPKVITDYGISLEMKHPDAVFKCGINGKTYFFKGHQYWHYNEKKKSIDPGYPRNISVRWGAVPYPVDTVMTWKDGKSYFFRGLEVYQYNCQRRLLHTRDNIGDLFFNCGHKNTENGAKRIEIFVSLITFLSIVVFFINF